MAPIRAKPDTPANSVARKELRNRFFAMLNPCVFVIQAAYPKPTLISRKPEGPIILTIYSRLNAALQPQKHLFSAFSARKNADPAIRKRAFDAGAIVAPSTPQALAARMERETAAWAEVVKAAKITAS
jgi:hypothetical protein